MERLGPVVRCHYFADEDYDHTIGTTRNRGVFCAAIRLFCRLPVRRFYAIREETSLHLLCPPIARCTAARSRTRFACYGTVLSMFYPASATLEA
jgi:hypothetical protein